MLPLALLLVAQPAPGGFVLHRAGHPPAAASDLTLPPDLYTARRAGRPRPPWPRGPHLVLHTGDRLAGTVVGGDARSVWVQTAFTGGNAGERLAVPLAAVAAVWVQPPPADVPPDVSRYSWADGPKRTDAVLLADGDVRRGVVELFAADGVRLSKGGLLPRANVVAVAFDPSLGRVRPAAGRQHRVTLGDGSRLTLGTVAADAGALRGKLVGGPEVTLPVEQVVAVDVLGGPAVCLSDLKPASQAVEGYAGTGWPWAADRSVKGQPLRVGADWFDKGLGTHPRTVLAYKLDGKYRRFEATVGPDPVTGGGAALVKLRADGRDITPAALGAWAVDVAGVNELTLEVGFGPFADMRADINWGDAKLVE